MPSFDRGDISIQYAVHGAGFPVLLLAPGGMRSTMEFWRRTPFNPVAALSSHFRVIEMDQRNAGASRAPISASDDWSTYAADQLALLNELGVERCHLLGGCIGGAFALKLISVAPSRVASAVLQQPIGNSGTNRETFRTLFDGWAQELSQARADVTTEALTQMESNFYDGDFVYSVPREVVMSCPVPLLVLRGDDQYHPAAISEEIARIAPRAELIQKWKTGDEVAHAVARVLSFLLENTPS
jgi:pimeloyl-ACP methyl ester carboxylesterase